MRPLTRLYAVKMYRQKLIYIFFACFFTASFFYAFLISTPQMEERLNIDIGMVGRENFPEFMMQSKIRVAVSMAVLFVLLTALINYTTAFMRWGDAIFEPAALRRTAAKYLLSGIYMSVVTLGITALCVCTRSTWKTICSAVIYLLLDAFIYDTGIPVLQKIWVGYYPNLYLFTYEYQQIPLRAVGWGIFVMALYGLLFYRTSLCQTQNMAF